MGRLAVIAIVLLLLAIGVIAGMCRVTEVNLASVLINRGDSAENAVIVDNIGHGVGPDTPTHISGVTEVRSLALEDAPHIPPRLIPPTPAAGQFRDRESYIDWYHANEVGIKVYLDPSSADDFRGAQGFQGATQLEIWTCFVDGISRPSRPVGGMIDPITLLIEPNQTHPCLLYTSPSPRDS